MNSELYELITKQYLEQDDQLPKHIVYLTEEENTVNYNGEDTFGKKFGNIFAIAKTSPQKHTVPFKILKEETIDISETTYSYYVLKEIPC